MTFAGTDSRLRPGSGWPGASGWSRHTLVSVSLWVAAGAATVLVTAAVVYRPAALLALVAALAVVVIVAMAFWEPRAVLVFELFLVIAYVPGALRSSTGAYVTDQVLVYLLLLAVVVRWYLATERTSFPSEKTLFVALVLVTALSVLFAANHRDGIAAVKEALISSVLVLLMLTLLDSASWLRRAMWAFALAAVFLAAVALFQQLTRTFDSDYFGFSRIVLDRRLHRAAGPLDPNFFAQMLVTAFSLLLYLRLATTNRYVRHGTLLPLALCLAAIAATFSRGGWIALLVVIGLVAVLRRARPWIPLASIAVIISVGVLFLPHDARSRLVEAFSPGSEGIANAVDPSVANRYTENLVALHMFLDHPALGVGAGNYPDRYLGYAQEMGLDYRIVGTVDAPQAPHSLYLQAFAELGLIGAGVLLAILGVALTGSWKARQRFTGSDCLLAEGTFVALVGFLVCSTFLHPAYHRYLWVTVGLALVARRLERMSVGTNQLGPGAGTAAGFTHAQPSSSTTP